MADNDRANIAVVSCRAIACALMLSFAAACDARPLGNLGADTAGPADMNQGPDAAVPSPDATVPLGLSADFSVDLRAQGGENTSASVLFWVGAEPPRAGRPGGRSVVLDEDAGEAITLNGTPLVGAVADWAYLYQAHSLPEPADGRWLFRLNRGGRLVEIAMTARRSRFVDFPTEPVSVSPGVTLRWAPAFPAESRIQAYLSSCSLGSATKEVGLDSFTYRGATLSVERCSGQAQVIASRGEPLGPPFDGGSLSASVWLDRVIELVP